MIKVTFGEEPKQEEKPFPKLMISRGDIFYMIREGYGLPLTDKSVVKWNFELTNFADFSNDFYAFTDYNGPVTIQNA